jgi:outer membrane protein
MSHLRTLLAAALIASAAPVFAQPEVSIQTPAPMPVIGRFLTPFHFERRVVSPAKLSNSGRLESLVRGGNLYLSVNDVIALVLENNLDIAIQRYGPYLAREVLRRAEGGGILRSIDQPVLAGPQSVSLAGVSLNASGLAAGANVGANGTIVTQAGPAPPNLDPGIYGYAVFGHSTSPQTNTLLNQTTSLTDNYRQYLLQYAQNFLTGTSLSFTYSSGRNFTNSPAALLNPFVQGYLDFTINQPLLQGFSIAVNNRDIRVARNNQKFTDLQLKRQVVETVSSVLNLYWDLVSFNDDMHIKEQALATAQKLLDDNRKEVKLGTLPEIEVTRAAAEVSADKEDLLIAQTNVAQQETVLKNALSRNGVANPWLDDVHIIPLDRIVVPKTDNIEPTPELIQQAMSRRPEIEQLRINLQSQRIMMRGTRNALRPSLNAFAEFTNNALAGVVNPQICEGCGTPDPALVGGYGTFLSQIAGRHYPNYSAGFSLNIAFRNRVAQADYVTDQLNLRQAELQLQRTANQIRVEVKNAVIGLQQARARYETAVNTQQLAEQNLKAAQDSFQYGVADVTAVVQAQRDLATDQTAEVQALANYTHAKIAFDQAIGNTLEENHITMAEAISGHVDRPSSLPASAPKQ